MINPLYKIFRIFTIEVLKQKDMFWLLILILVLQK